MLSKRARMTMDYRKLTPIPYRNSTHATEVDDALSQGSQLKRRSLEACFIWNAVPIAVPTSGKIA